VGKAAGDEEGFSQFVSASWASLVRTAVLLTGDRTSAEDLVQTSLLRLFTKWTATQDPTAYVRTVLFREFFRHRRHYRAIDLSHNGAAPPASTWDHSDQVAAAEVLRQALMGLPRPQRAVLVLRYFEQLDEAQIARQLGCSPGTVKSRAARGLAALRSTNILQGP
jgi:RNA polymerase sigma-70 factor (sigma-E family)